MSGASPRLDFWLLIAVGLPCAVITMPGEQGCLTGDGLFEMSLSTGSMMFTSLLFLREALRNGAGGDECCTGAARWGAEARSL